MTWIAQEPDALPEEPAQFDLDRLVGREPLRPGSMPAEPETVLSSQADFSDNGLMKSTYRERRFPPEVIRYALWLYHRFTLSLRDVEDLLAERGITVSYEAIRNWCMKFGPTYARSLRRKQGRHGDIWHVDELFITIRGERHHLRRAVDQDGEVIDILITKGSRKNNFTFCCWLPSPRPPAIRSTQRHKKDT